MTYANRVWILDTWGHKVSGNRMLPSCLKSRQDFGNPLNLGHCSIIGLLPGFGKRRCYESQFKLAFKLTSG